MTIEDLRKWYGLNYSNSAGKYHRQIRDALSAGVIPRIGFTIKEFCEHSGFELSEVWTFLRPNTASPY